MAAPGLDALIAGLMMHHARIQMHHWPEQATGIDHRGLILTPGAIAIVRHSCADGRLDLGLQRISQIAVIPQAGKPAAGFEDAGRFGECRCAVADVE